MHSRVANQKYTKMKLTQRAIELFRKDTQIKNTLASFFECSVYSVERWIKDNKDNGPLTTVLAIQILEKEIGLTQEEILEAESAEVIPTAQR